MQGLLLAHHFHGRNAAGKACEHSDQCNVPAGRAGANGLGQGAGTTHFHDDVNAAAAGRGQHYVAPIWFVLVVDDLIGPQCKQVLFLGVG
ncbi:hypothetical protein D3C72_2351920 [compost metagenome]